ncbi:putative cyclohexyl-isocyanide hydratase [Leptospira ryugenii]|uniref:Putative cyclohexyl-isocyanide hydratase n=1 Tax=Leptospira ryugenii TaxID=1917863 RepID=A0A2P2DZY1_9LEPT|nr:DJ-1/PfpI family protein [Leptospira ryugenii]GBF50183.1 putative cyclohexyl-isocyanide hydratase [Leptospira ryugenii]
MNLTMLLFDDVTILDFIGPYQVFSKIKNWKLSFVSWNQESIVCEGGLQISGLRSIKEIKESDLLFVPGGTGINAILTNPDYLKEIKRVGENSKYITSVCTGSLVLGAAGLLTGYKASSHWRSLHFLERFGAIPCEDRVVIDRNRITGGGITAGIDFGLKLVQWTLGDERAKELELWLEYNPEPPFGTGHPRLAETKLLEKTLEDTQAAINLREEIIQKIVPWKKE